jgi:hypothetical protein
MAIFVLHRNARVSAWHRIDASSESEASASRGGAAPASASPPNFDNVIAFSNFLLTLSDT